MRTTIDLDEETLRLIKSIASQRQQSMGKVISDLARDVLTDEDIETLWESSLSESELVY